jgi:hypothetical protein
MREYILKFKLKRYYRKNARERKFLNLKDIHTFLVLFNTAQCEQAQLCIGRLRKLKKQVTAYAYQEEGDKRDHSGSGYRIVLQEAVEKWFNNPSGAIVKELQRETFDAVIDLTIYRNTFLEYLLAHSRALIKTGLKKNNLPQYDLAISRLPDDESSPCPVEELCKQILHYLNAIQG